MVAILTLLIGALRDCIMSRGRLEAEVIVLRHQLNILRRQSPRRVRPNAFDRALFVCLYRHFPDIGNAVAIICPETVIRWHRMSFCAWWRWKSGNPGGRPKIDPELRDLVRRMCGGGRRNILWIGVTTNPTAHWLAHQITEAFPWDTAPTFLIRDNDCAYGEVLRSGFGRWAFATALSRLDRHGRTDMSSAQSAQSDVSVLTT
jgi:hypothetical protein